MRSVWPCSGAYASRTSMIARSVPSYPRTATSRTPGIRDRASSNSWSASMFANGPAERVTGAAGSGRRGGVGAGIRSYPASRSRVAAASLSASSVSAWAWGVASSTGSGGRGGGAGSGTGGGGGGSGIGGGSGGGGGAGAGGSGIPAVTSTGRGSRSGASSNWTSWRRRSNSSRCALGVLARSLDTDYASLARIAYVKCSFKT